MAYASLQSRCPSILSNNCFKCHGPDEQTRQAGLRLDTRDGALEAIRVGVDSRSPYPTDQRHPTNRSECRRPKSPHTGSPIHQIAVLRRWML
ncbi:MAG: hypothetical protein KF705_08990 [Phycisphaeraceae bacterium]|nr:hypothetical protein [Phycisphaeraceae bacterium]